MSATREKLVARLEEIDKRLAALKMTNERVTGRRGEEEDLVAERDLLTVHLTKMPPQDLKDPRVLRG